MVILEDEDQYCFACGMNNLDGLRIQWQVKDSSMTGEFVPDRKYQGWKGILHGGIVATLLDEAMARLAWILSGGALTAEMTVRYIAPVLIGQKIFIKGEKVKENRKIMEMRATLSNEKGEVLAYSTGKVIKI
jgi:uncharacterized protein (TIGR00369 family)